MLLTQSIQLLQRRLNLFVNDILQLYMSLFLDLKVFGKVTFTVLQLRIERLYLRSSVLSERLEHVVLRTKLSFKCELVLVDSVEPLVGLILLGVDFTEQFVLELFFFVFDECYKYVFRFHLRDGVVDDQDFVVDFGRLHLDRLLDLCDISLDIGPESFDLLTGLPLR